MKFSHIKNIIIVALILAVAYPTLTIYNQFVVRIHEQNQVVYARQQADIKAMEDGKKTIFGFVCTKFKDTVNKF